jgi:hypothetical protein
VGSWQCVAGGSREHIVTGARNMREHRERKRLAAEERNAQTAPERRSRKAIRPEPTPKAGKLSKQQRRKREAASAVERDWAKSNGPGVDC